MDRTDPRRVENILAYCLGNISEERQLKIDANAKTWRAELLQPGREQTGSKTKRGEEGDKDLDSKQHAKNLGDKMGKVAVGKEKGNAPKEEKEKEPAKKLQKARSGQGSGQDRDDGRRVGAEPAQDLRRHR